MIFILTLHYSMDPISTVKRQLGIASRLLMRDNCDCQLYLSISIHLSVCSTNGKFVPVNHGHIGRWVNEFLSGNIYRWKGNGLS